MRRTIALLALWLTAAIVCTTLGWLTVGLVSGRSRQSTLQPLIETAATSRDEAAATALTQPAIIFGSTTASTPTSPRAAIPAPLPPSSTRATIASRGGSVAVNYDPSTGTVTLQEVTPHRGFTVNLQHTGPNQIEVRFEATGTESRVFAWWDGRPRQHVEERD